MLTSAAKARGCKDATLAIAFTAILYALSCEDAQPALMASQAATVLASQLLQVGVHTFT